MEKRIIDYIKKNIFDSFNTKSEYNSHEYVKVEWKGQTMWDGPVPKFKLFNHTDSNYCYAFYEVSSDRKMHRVNLMFDFGKTYKPVSVYEVVRIYLLKRHEEAKSIGELGKLWNLESV